MKRSKSPLAKGTRAAAALLGLLLLAAPAGAAETTAPAPVRMAYLQNDLHHLPLWVALEKGFFKEQGVDVTVAGTFRAGPELMTAMRAGSLDMGYVGMAPATITFARGFETAHLVAQANTGGSAIVVSAKGDLKTVADLRGRRIAVPGNGTVQDFLLRRSIAGAGLQPTDVKILVLPAAEMSKALSRGEIDAFVAWQPFPARAVLAGEGRVLADSADLWAGHPCCGVMATDAAIESGAAAKVAAAHVKAVEFIRANPEEAVAIGVKRTGMDEKTVREAFSHVTYATAPAVEGELEYVDFLLQAGFIKVDDGKAMVGRLVKSLVK